MVRNGIAFVWSEKEILGEIIEAMEEKGFIYIEIFQIIFISSQLCADALGSQQGRGNGCGDSKATSATSSAAELSEDEPKKITVEVDKGMIMENLNELKTKNIDDLFFAKNYPFFKKSKHTMLMFRRVREKEGRCGRICLLLFLKDRR